MNERIRELAEQAGFYYTDKTGFIAPAGCDPAKFAKLIVSECMDVLDPGENQLIARFQARQWLAEHFGDE
jgi:hypothetical protein